MKKIAYDEKVCNQRLFEIIKEADPVNLEGVVEHVKAVKNSVEMEGMRSANIKNCASLVQYFAWMEDFLAKNPDQTEMTEYTAIQKLDEYRSARELF